MSHRFRVLDWDTQFFGVRIGRIEQHWLDADVASAALLWAKELQLECLYFLANSDSAETIEAAEAYGFGMKDVRITYDWTPAPLPTRPTVPASARIRPAQSEDIPLLEQVARASHTDTRYFFDQRFDRESAANLYAIWIRQSCEGQSRAVLTLEWEGQAAGYITCDIQGQEGQIGLVAVHEELRGHNLGSALVWHAQSWFLTHAVTRVTVPTQARNIVAQRMYQKAGFRTQLVQIWYHRWLTY